MLYNQRNIRCLNWLACSAPYIYIYIGTPYSSSIVLYIVAIPTSDGTHNKLSIEVDLAVGRNPEETSFGRTLCSSRRSSRRRRRRRWRTKKSTGNFNVTLSYLVYTHASLKLAAR